MQAKAAAVLSLGLDAYNRSITFAAGSEVEGGSGNGDELVPAKLMQLLCSLCALLQMVLPTTAGVQRES